jgi:hypothetical protein
MQRIKALNPLNLFKELLLKKKKIIVGSVDVEQLNTLIRRLWPYDVGKAMIRLGSENDGGYLVPDELDGITACFSPGVDKTTDFERDCAKHGMKLFLADLSVEKTDLNLQTANYSFLKKHIGVTNSKDFITMDEWFKISQLGPEEDLLLQMDIEGCEYLSLIATSDEMLKRFRIIIVEFHDLHNLWEKDFFNQAEATFSKLLQNHTCVHLHPNNYAKILSLKGINIPNLIEFTFIRNDRIEAKTFQRNFPHKLDSDNTSSNKVVLPRNWYFS